MPAFRRPIAPPWIPVMNRPTTTTLAMDSTLRALAREYARDLFQRGYFSHTSKEGLSPFDRMRNAVSLSLPLNATFKAEAGYLNQYRFVRGGDDLVDHALPASITASF